MTEQLAAQGLSQAHGVQNSPAGVGFPTPANATASTIVDISSKIDQMFGMMSVRSLQRNYKMK